VTERKGQAGERIPEATMRRKSKGRKSKGRKRRTVCSYPALEAQGEINSDLNPATIESIFVQKTSNNVPPDI